MRAQRAKTWKYSLAAKHYINSWILISDRNIECRKEMKKLKEHRIIYEKFKLN